MEKEQVGGDERKTLRNWGGSATSIGEVESRNKAPKKKKWEDKTRGKGARGPAFTIQQNQWKKLQW